mgnify:FL=1
MQGNAIYRFADCELDPHERRLLVHGQPVILTPKVFDTLVLLVGRAGHVVSKDELMTALWPRGFVHESNLTKHIWLLRRALGDGEDESRYIETVSKLGYRFIAPVISASDGSGITTASTATIDPALPTTAPSVAITVNLPGVEPAEDTVHVFPAHEPAPAAAPVARWRDRKSVV